jgi:hypothetical protein
MSPLGKAKALKAEPKSSKMLKRNFMLSSVQVVVRRCG